MSYTVCMPYTIELEGVRKAFGGTPVLAGLDLRARPGTVLALLGANGAGKTTTVRILCTLLRPDGGAVRVAGHDVAAHPDRVRRAIAVTAQHAAVDDVLTGEEQLVLVGRLHRLSRRDARARAAELLEAFDLGAAARRRVGTYSGGMRRRLDLAATLVARPEVVVLDEPTTGLDPRSRRDVWRAIGELRDAGSTVLLTTQYLEEADALADHVAVLRAGRVAAEGTPEALKARVGEEAVVLTFAAPAHRDRAAALLAGVTNVCETIVTPGVTLRVATGGAPDDVRRVLERLAAGGVPAARLELHRPTLDDVFLTLTDPATEAAR